MSLKPVFSILFLFFWLLSFSQPSNDNPCNAIVLPVNNSCSFTNYMNLGATATGGVPAPGCAGYAGGDVWFRFTMPGNGYSTVIEMGAVGMTDGGMAVYSGANCSSLTLVSCDDNSGGGNMPLITVDDGCGFENIGATFWVRVWENGNDNNGIFDICAYSIPANSPPGVTACSGNLIAGDACCDAILLGEDLDGYCGNTAGFNDFPDEIPGYCAFLENNSWIAFIAADSTVVINITSSNCLFNNGIQVSILATNDCTNFSTVSNCWNPTAEGTGTLTAANLTIGETYYIMVDGWGGDECDYVIDVVSGVQTVTVTTNDDEICQGQSTQLNANVLGSGSYTYSWSPAGSLNNPGIANPIASPTVSTIYTVTITGIEDSIQTVSVTVFPAAPAPPVITGPNGVCRNASGLVYYANTANATAYSWTASGSATISGSTTADSVIVNFGSTNGSVCVTASNDCGTSPQACFNVSVVAEPIISATNPPAVCSGNSFNLTTIAITNSGGGGGPITYHNNLSDANAAINPILPPTVNVSGTYYIRMQTGSNCYDVTSVTVTIENPQLQVTDPPAKCTPNSTDLASVTINEINGFSGGNYTFYADSLNAANENAPMASTIVFASNIYWVRYETPNGCFDVAPINVIIENTPDITVVQPAPICPGGQIDLDTVTLIDANGAVFTKYFYTSQALAILGNPALALSNTVVSAPQTYYLRAVTANNCLQIVGITVTVGTAPQGSITGGGTFCQGSNVNITFNLTGNGPFDVVYTDGSSFFPLNNISNGYIETVVVAGNSTYSLFSVWDTNGCGGTITGSPVNINESTPVSAVLSGDATICGPGMVPLIINLSGSGPFDVEYSYGVNPPVVLNAINNGHVEMVNVSGNTIFTLTGVVDAFGCTGSTSGTATINVIAPLQVTNLLESCDVSYTSYTVSFEITGGNPPYNITGGTGTLNGNIFTSDPIAAGNSYSFNVNDSSSCPDQVVSGIQNCPCSTDAGTMDMNPLQTCVNGTVSGFHNPGTEVLNPGDILQFALHNGLGSIPWTIYALSAAPDFGIQAGMNTGTTYYISAMAGPDDGSGNVDRNHICFSVSPGTPVLFNELPVAIISGGATICNGTSTFLTFNFTSGVPPFDVVYTDGTNNFTLQDIVDGFQLEVFPTATSNYTIISVTDNTGVSCQGTFSGNALVNVIDAPVETQLNFICNSTNTAFQVEFEIINGDPATYTVSGDPGNLDNFTKIFTSAWMTSGSNYYFEIDDVNGCGPTIVSGSYICNCTSNAGTMGVTTLTICEDETAVAQHNTGSLNFDGNDVLGFVVHDAPATTLGNIFLTGSTPDFNYDPVLNFGATYYISAVVADDDGSGFPVLDPLLDPCISIAAGQPVVFSQTPVASISGNNTICQGDSTDITFNIVGSGPFNVNYLVDGTNTMQLNGISSGYTLRVSPGSSTDYEIVSVNMATSPNCTGVINPANNLVSISIIEVPVISNFQINCSSTVNEFEVSFEINGGNSSNYSVLGNVGTLTGNIFTSDWMPGGTTYSFQVDDGSGCPSQIISAIEYCNCTPDISPSITLVDAISCNGENDGALEVTNINGVPPFNFEWSNSTSGTNNSSLSSGLYVVTMTDANNCISLDSFSLTEPTPIEATLVVENPDCFGEDDGSIAFENVTGGSGNYNFSLNVITSYSANLFYDLSGGVYVATITDTEGCEWSSEVVVEDPEQFTMTLGADLLIEFGDSVQIRPQVNAPVADFSWSSTAAAPCDTCFNQAVAPMETATYFLSVINEQGCEVHDEITINVSEERPVYIPSAFTPNGDGFNDHFKIYCGSAVEQIKVLRIYNRWGALVYEINDINPGVDDFGWDGTLKDEFLENGVYVYYAEIQFRDSKISMFKGDVTLLR